jgi:hypothetical protein
MTAQSRLKAATDRQSDETYLWGVLLLSQSVKNAFKSCLCLKNLWLQIHGDHFRHLLLMPIHGNNVCCKLSTGVVWLLSCTVYAEVQKSGFVSLLHDVLSNTHFSTKATATWRNVFMSSCDSWNNDWQLILKRSFFGIKAVWLYTAL